MYDVLARHSKSILEHRKVCDTKKCMYNSILKLKKNPMSLVFRKNSYTGLRYFI